MIAASRSTAHELDEGQEPAGGAARCIERERVSRLATQMGIDGIVAHDPLRALHRAGQVRRGHRRRRAARGQEVSRREQPAAW